MDATISHTGRRVYNHHTGAFMGWMISMDAKTVRFVTREGREGRTARRFVMVCKTPDAA